LAEDFCFKEGRTKLVLLRPDLKQKPNEWSELGVFGVAGNPPRGSPKVTLLRSRKAHLKGRMKRWRVDTLKRVEELFSSCRSWQSWCGCLPRAVGPGLFTYGSFRAGSAKMVSYSRLTVLIYIMSYQNRIIYDGFVLTFHCAYLFNVFSEPDQPWFFNKIPMWDLLMGWRSLTRKSFLNSGFARSGEGSPSDIRELLLSHRKKNFSFQKQTAPAGN